jgi:hypothetical protein
MGESGGLVNGDSQSPSVIMRILSPVDADSVEIHVEEPKKNGEWPIKTGQNRFRLGQSSYFNKNLSEK